MDAGEDAVRLLVKYGLVEPADRGAAAQDQGREQLRRFLAPGTGYKPTRVEVFRR
jgi:conjugal transfer/entry exclusion protein